MTKIEILGRVSSNVSPDRKLQLSRITLPPDLEPIQPPVFPRSWINRFEAEFSHNDPDICNPIGCCGGRMKQTFNFIGEDIAQSYCVLCRTIVYVNVKFLIFMLGTKSQNNHEKIIQAILANK